MQVWNLQLAENAWPKKSPKIPHLHTITQLFGACCKIEGLSGVSCAKTAKLIEMPCGMWTWVGPGKHECTLAQLGEYDWTVYLQRRCGLMSNYFEHLFSLVSFYVYHKSPVIMYVKHWNKHMSLCVFVQEFEYESYCDDWAGSIFRSDKLGKAVSGITHDLNIYIIFALNFFVSYA